jgi:hypothetical protein
MDALAPHPAQAAAARGSAARHSLSGSVDCLRYRADRRRGFHDVIDLHADRRHVISHHIAIEKIALEDVASLDEKVGMSHGILRNGDGWFFIQRHILYLKSEVCQ